MLKLVFAEAGPGPTLELGPFAAIRVDGEVMRAERGGGPIAQHQAHSWIGPFFHFSCADGIAYGDGAIYANVDLETKRWYGHVDGRYWRELVITSASAPPA
jgi:hypothetical protein